jgi:hypothetical protein
MIRKGGLWQLAGVRTPHEEMAADASDRDWLVEQMPGRHLHESSTPPAGPNG